MDFRHIRAFIAVADALSVTKAAERLHISQPPLSRHIQQLENELGLTLFVRHRQGVTLTEPGRQLLEEGASLDAAAQTFHEAAKQARSTEGARVRVGIGWGLWDVVNRVRIEFAKDHPDVTVEATDAYCWFDSDEQLRTHALDLAFARPPYDASFNVSEPLFHERIQAIICADSPLAGRESVSVRDLADETLLLWERHAAPVLYDRILDVYAKAGVTPKTMPTPNAGPFNHAGMMLVASGKGLYMGYGVPQTGPTPASGVSVVPLSDHDATIEVSIVSRRNDASAVAADFIACAQQLYQPGAPCSCLAPSRAAEPPDREMRLRFAVVAGAAAVIGAVAFPAGVPVSAQQPAKAYTAPRTPWGHPDLQGTYSNDDETGTPMERPAQFEGKRQEDLTPAEFAKLVKDRNDAFNKGVEGTEFAGGLRPPTHLIFDSFERKNRRAWLVVDPPDGRIPPMTDEARRRPRAPGGVSTNFNPVGPFNSWLDMGLYDRCITRGIPASMMPAGYGSYYAIVQSPDSVAIRYEMIHETRVVPFDRRPNVSPAIKQYLGDARAWWDGETLVVETRNFPQETAPQRGSEKVVMTERFTAVSRDIVEWRVTFDDPTTWTRPWTYMMPLTKVEDSKEVYEYACHEGNNAMRNILSAQRAAERQK